MNQRQSLLSCSAHGAVRRGGRPSAGFPLAAICLAMMLSASCAAAEEQKVKSKVESVTLYRGQALVTRTVELPAAAGEVEAVVSDLPEQVLGETLFASGQNVKIRSVRFRTVPVAEPPGKAAAELETKMKALQDKIAANSQTLTVLENKMKYLDKLENFTAPTLQVEMAKGVLNAAQLSELTTFLFKQRDDLAAQRIKMGQEGQQLQEQLNLLQRQRQELAAGMSRSDRQAAIFLSKDAGPVALRLSYLVRSASWAPSYELRLDETAQSVTVDYVAQVQQTSGEDWTDVALTLSTATPALNAEIPLLTPMMIGLAGGAKQMRPQPTTAAAAQSYSAISRSQSGALGAWHAATADRAMANWELNRLSAEAQSLELAATDETLRQAKGLRALEEGLAVSYKVPARMTLHSRQDTQMVQILSGKVKGKGFYEAIPLLTNYVYRGLEVVNTTEQPWLAGPYMGYVDGEFVGRGELPMVAKGQDLHLGFGVDTQLRCWRELKEKSEEEKLGSKIETFTYVLHVDSYKDKPVAVRLIDRIPIAKGDEMETKVGKTSQPLSADPAYAEGQDKVKGLLRWDVEVPAGAHAHKDFKLDYSFEMKYASDRRVNAAPSQMMEEMRQEYDMQYKAKH